MLCSRKFYQLFICLLSLILLLFAFNTSFAANDGNELTSLLNQLRTMKADFVEVIFDNHGKVIQKTFGQMALDRPGKFRWQVSKPIPQLIIANQKKLWIYDPDLEQVTIRSLQKASNDAPALLLSHVNTVLEKDYQVKKLTSKTPNWNYFQLIPKRADSMFEKIVLGFNGNQIGKMSLVDHLGHSTKIDFLHARFNISLAPQLFDFKPSKNIDVINETRS